MGRPLIVLGDKTDHSGTVVTAASMTDQSGKGIACVGDKVHCPKHGTTTIVTGDQTMLIDNRPVARDGDKTDCGATLIASQQSMTIA